MIVQRHERRRDGESLELPGHPHRRRVERVGDELHPAAQPARLLDDAVLVLDEDPRHRRAGVVRVRRQVAALQRVDDMPVPDLRDVHVTVRCLHVAEDRLPRRHVLPLADDADDVEVLEDRRAAGGDEVHRRGPLVADTAVRDRVDRRSVGRRDVDALVEGEAAGSLDPVLAHVGHEDGARVAEEAADRMLPVERLDRPRIRDSPGRESQGYEDDGEDEAMSHGPLSASELGETAANPA